MTRYNSILDTVGNTPIVRINNLAPAHVNLFVKIESFNPMGSVKDRFALEGIEQAERSGELKSGQTVVEATSGNTGIALAMVCAQKGYPLVVTMAESFSVERRKLMRFLGAKVVLTPAAAKGSGMVAKAAELAEANGWWQSKQFENPANADVHEKTTAVEILEDFSDTTLDYWVSGFGTGGTLNGVSRVLRDKSPNTKIVLCEPDNSQIIGSGIPQARNADGGHSESHPNFRPHLMQGWSPDFIPVLAEQAVKASHIDQFLPVDGADSLKCTHDLASKEGIFVGISAGATFSGALQIAATAPKGSNILCMLPDTGERYLTTPLFDNISEDMDEEELSISRSTPGYRFDESSAPAPVPKASTKAEDARELDAAAVSEVEAALANVDKPVALFALEWCEFCWSVRNMLAEYGIDYQSIDLDSVAYQAGNRGGNIRQVLLSKTGSNTIPQIFIAGQSIGGCTELFDFCKDGNMAELLSKNSIPFDESVSKDPYEFLPGWLHSR
jgi:cysteine synthase